MRVVIVGGAGFIGRALAASLSTRGVHAEVWDTAGRLSGARDALSGSTTRTFDFTGDRVPDAGMEGVDALVHLGCTTNPAHSMGTMAYDAASNIAPSLRLFDAAAAAGVARVVFASSGGTVYGAPERLPVVETDSTEPLSAYGVSKLAIERYLALYPLCGISLRIANPYGAYQLRGTTVGVIARYIAAVRDGRPLEVWGDGSVVRDYIAIDDVITAFERALVVPALSRGPYNIATGIGCSINDIIAAVAQVSGRAPDVRYLAGRTYDVPAIVLDCARFRSATEWAPRTSLLDGISALWRAAAAPPGG